MSSKNTFRKYHQGVKQFGSRSARQNVGHDLGPNCLHRFSAGSQFCSLSVIFSLDFWSNILSVLLVKFNFKGYTCR